MPQEKFSVTLGGTRKFFLRHFVSLVNQLIQLFYILCLAGRRMLCLGRVLLYGSLGLLDRLHGSRTGYAAAWAGHTL